MAARCLTMLPATRYEILLTRNLHIPFSSSPLHARSPTREYISAVSPVCRLCHPWVPSSQTCADKLRTSVSANFIPNPQILCVLYRFVLYILLLSELSEQFLLPEQFSLPEQSKAPKHVAIFRSNPVWMLQIDDPQGSTSQFAFYFSLLPLHTLKHSMRICKCNILLPRLIIDTLSATIRPSRGPTNLLRITWIILCRMLVLCHRYRHLLRFKSIIFVHFIEIFAIFRKQMFYFVLFSCLAFDEIS